LESYISVFGSVIFLQFGRIGGVGREKGGGRRIIQEGKGRGIDSGVERGMGKEKGRYMP
jgi:hypothetical protein